VSEDPSHGATTIRASKDKHAGHDGGGGGGGYLAWKNYGPVQSDAQTAYNQYDSGYADDDPLRAGPVDSEQGIVGQSASDDSAPEPAARATRPSTAARSSTAQSAEVPEETIGITPASVDSSDVAGSSIEDSEEVIVRGARRPIWASVPSERRLASLYPARALERGSEGEARLSCTVQSGGALACTPTEQTSTSFGNAAVRVSRNFRHAPTLADGSNAAGTPVNLRVVFRMDDEPRRG
jgi:TonB family protein